jgi:hypothetical protein
MDLVIAVHSLHRIVARLTRVFDLCAFGIEDDRMSVLTAWGTRCASLQETVGDHPRTDRASRIIDILGFTPDPYRTPEEMLSRANLLSELQRHSIFREVPANIAAIFRCLEQVCVPPATSQ